MHNPLRLPRETTSERPKALHTSQFFALLTSKCASHHNGVHFFDISTSKSAPELLCASRHNGVHFFDISTSKSAPELLCFVHFDFRMCFAPQRRAEESEKRKSQKKAPKGREIANNSVFPMVCGSGASKSRLAKAAGAEPSGQMRDEKLHAVVARSTFGSQNVQITPFSDHFWKLRCRKSARRPLIFSVLTLSSDSFSSLSR